ncbi:MAG: hypothetical protein IJ316_04715 [Clostridia bacterium]|nr:hypothetical protein [Clostridia bacterium]
MLNYEALRERLSDMGFETEENEESELKRALERAEMSIVNAINCESVPDELRFTLLDIAAGEYLLAVKSREGGNVVKSVSEGDVSVTFSDESDTDELIDTLLSSGREEILSFRRLKW